MNPDQLRELQELAHQLEELTKTDAWKILVDYAQYGDGMLASHQKYLISGLCKTTEEYQKQAGWVQGCLAVLNAPENVRKMSDKYSAEAQESGEDTE